MKTHQDIEKFVILDDYHVEDFEEHYPEQFVYCDYVFTKECYNKALGILTKK